MVISFFRAFLGLGWIKVVMIEGVQVAYSIVPGIYGTITINPRVYGRWNLGEGSRGDIVNEKSRAWLLIYFISSGRVCLFLHRYGEASRSLYGHIAG